MFPLKNRSRLKVWIKEYAVWKRGEGYAVGRECNEVVKGMK